MIWSLSDDTFTTASVLFAVNPVITLNEITCEVGSVSVSAYKYTTRFFQQWACASGRNWVLLFFFFSLQGENSNGISERTQIAAILGNNKNDITATRWLIKKKAIVTLPILLLH